MAIYKYNENFYLNAVSGSYFSKNPKHVSAHEVSKEKIQSLIKVYKYSTIVCLAVLPFSIWFGPIYTFAKNSISFLYINTLLSVIGITIFSILFVTLTIRSSATIVDLAKSKLAASESVVIYLYYLVFSLNLCLLLTFAPWKDGERLPPTMIPGIVYFLCALFFSAYRLLLIWKWLKHSDT